VLLRLFFALACVAFISGCSKTPAGRSSPSAQGAAAATTISTFPATLEGNLTVQVSNDWGYFGDIAANGAEYPVAIPGSLFEAAGVADAGGKVRVVVDSKQDLGNSFQYVVSSITKL